MTKRGRGKQHKKSKRHGPSAPAAGEPAAPAARGRGATKAGSKAGAARGKGKSAEPRTGRFKDGRGAADTRGAPAPGNGVRSARSASGYNTGGGFQRRAPAAAEPATADAASPRLANGVLRAAQAETLQHIQGWLAESAALRDATPKTAATEWPLDPWQQEVLDALVAGKSVVVDAPTTAGKTRAVETFFRQNLRDPLFRAAYTTPVKSLSNDKLREFRAMFGTDNVGIATGDIKENLGAPLVVATLESYRNSLLGVEPDLGRTLVVFDEYHYVQDESRGSAWEEALILTPRTCQVLLLSASVGNAEEFTAWLSTILPGRDCVLVRTEKRPVPLVDLVFDHGAWLLPSTLPSLGRAPRAAADDEVRDRPIRQEVIAERAALLLDLGLTPTIIYCGRRLSCETMATLLCRGLQPLPEDAAARIGESLMASQREVHALSFIQPKLRHMLQVYGVGYHHSGLAAPARMAIEALVKNGLLRFCTATMGLSLGINFSVRSALISDYQRPGEQGFTDYGPSEVLQMLGRAGRRGKDAVGFSLWPTATAFQRLGGAKRDGVQSRLRTDPTTFLGLVGRGYSLDAIERFYAKSFRAFTHRSTDLDLITYERVSQKLRTDSLPCTSPAAEASRFWRGDAASLCRSCPHREPCHALLKPKKGSGQLAALHLHLHTIGALQPDESLTEFGRIARFFPQSGGLVIAKLVTSGAVTDDNLAKVAELAAALALARFKEPGGDPHYRLPFRELNIEALLTELYPHALFPEVYDPPFRQRTYPLIREYNPAAGGVIRDWIQGMPWKDLNAQVTTEQYGTGDVMALIYRSATYLQSIVQAGLPGLSPMAKTLRDLMLREPLSYALAI